MIELLYIASPSYSGSTLLTLLLNAHPSIATVGELKWGNIDLENYECSCGSLLRECTFWENVVARMEAEGLHFSLQRPATAFRHASRPWLDRVARSRVRGRLYESARSLALASSPTARQSWSYIQRVNRAAIEIILDLQGGRIFLDGSKDPVRLQYLLESGDYDVRIIQLVRDGRGVVYSAIKNAGDVAETAALEWRRTHEQIERLARRLGDGRFFRMRYEDLCSEPDATMDRVCAFLGIETQQLTKSCWTAEHHVLGNRMRLRRDLEIKLNEAWRDALDSQALDAVERIGGPLNRRYGYV
jgi:hypothetical protein